MNKKRKSELVCCQYLNWLISQRNGVYQADGRANPQSAGRHSLGTRNHERALENLKKLDVIKAVELGNAPQSLLTDTRNTLGLIEGRDEYLAFAGRPRALKGAKESTQKTYRGVFAKAIPFFEQRDIHHWNAVAERELEAYAGWLDELGYAHATLVKEVVTLKQALNHWIARGMLPAEQQFTMYVDKVTESNTYCYTREQVEAMVQRCRGKEKLNWLADVIIGLAYTGWRISELAALRWSAIDFDRNMFSIIDESRVVSRARNTRRTTKSSKSRSIPIHPDLRNVLTVLRQRGATGLVFRAMRGGPLHSRNVLQAFIDEVIGPLKDRFPSEDGDGGFATGRLRSMRHYFCSWCANSGVPETVLMRWLGHASSIMVRRYYHLHDEEAQLQIKKLGKLRGLDAS